MPLLVSVKIDKPVPDLLPFQRKQFTPPHAGEQGRLHHGAEVWGMSFRSSEAVKQGLNFGLSEKPQPLVILLKHEPLAFLKG